PRDAKGIALPILARTIDGETIRYPHVTCTIDRSRGLAEIVVQGPASLPPSDVDWIREQGASFWPLVLARALDDLILHLRTTEEQVGLGVLKPSGDADRVEPYDRLLAEHAADWRVREVRLYLKRVFKRLDVSSRSIFAIVEPGSCFAGTLLEL